MYKFDGIKGEERILTVFALHIPNFLSNLIIFDGCFAAYKIHAVDQNERGGAGGFRRIFFGLGAL